MLSLPPRRLDCALALSLLCLSLLVRAQTPLAKPMSKTAPPQVRLQVDFVSSSFSDIENLGVTFDSMPASTSTDHSLPKGTKLQSLVGGLTAEVYRTLARARSRVFHALPASTTNGVPITFQVDTKLANRVTYVGALSQPIYSLPRYLSVKAQLYINPRINTDGSVTLTLVPQAGNSNASPAEPKASVARTVASGQMLLLAGLPLSSEKQTDDQELLVFVTPTVLNADSSPIIPKPAAAPVVDTAQPALPMPGTAESKTGKKTP